MADVNDLQSFRSNVTQAEKCEAVEWLADQNNKYARILHWELVRLNFDEGRCDADGFPITQPPTDQPAAGVDWRPIETAPKDGTNIIAGVAGIERSTGEAFWWEGGWRTWDGENHSRTIMYPTHWIPMPSVHVPHSVPCAAQETPRVNAHLGVNCSVYDGKPFYGVHAHMEPYQAFKEAIDFARELERELSALRSTESVIRPEPLRLNDMTHVGELFSLRMVDGCSHGCAELYVEDDEYYHLKARFDRYWLDDLAFVIRKALESTHPADSNKEGV